MDASLHARTGHDDIQYRGMQLFAVQLAFLIAAGLFTLARAYVKVCIVKSVAVDDWLIFGAMVLMYTVYGGVALHGITNGATGKHITELTVEQAAVSLRAWYICEVLYSPITLAIRTSICLLLLRLAVSRVHRWIIYVNLAVVWAISIAFFLIMTFQCMPPSYFWRQLYGDPGSCINLNIVPDATIAHSVISALSDWCIGLLPIALLWNVNLNRRTKALVAVLLSMGMVAGVALIVRIPYVKRLAISADFLYETIDVAIWSVMEPALGIIAASVTSMRPLFQGWGFGWSSNSKHSRPSGAAWPDSEGRPAAHKESPISPRVKGTAAFSENTNSTGRRTYDDIERALSSPAGSDIELNKTAAAAASRGSAENEYPESRPSSDLGQRGGQMPRQEVQGRPVINVRTTIDITTHPIGHVLPQVTCVSDNSDDEERREAQLERADHRVAPGA
ncbi:integral membrane protein [Colletotrichum musicola]|uniref:Integral membrane protein n=1 Tax=Colletotrichum musicola TaxID=2175873 RepID=A0A8H6U5Q9_9PEZI|nr:integral membrane protein [Colletotrichum musicola]